MNSPVKELPLELQQGDLVSRYVEWGDMAVRYAQLPAGTDQTPVLEGLPGDRCPSNHWGIVLEGSVTLVGEDGSKELTRAGEVYYWPAGHTAFTDEGTVLIEIGPRAPMRQFGYHAKAKLG